MEINVGPKKDSKVWLVISDVCMTDCVHLQCKPTHGTMCFKILTSQSDCLYKHARICAISVPFICFFWQILPFLFSFIKHSSALSKIRCWQYCITNAPLSICLSLLLLLSRSWNSSREHCNAYIFLSLSLSFMLVSQASLTPPSPSLLSFSSSLCFLLEHKSCSTGGQKQESWYISVLPASTCRDTFKDTRGKDHLETVFVFSSQRLRNHLDTSDS